MKILKCPACGSEKVILMTTLSDVEFWIDEKGKIGFYESDIKNALYDSLHIEGWLCECEHCGENWADFIAIKIFPNSTYFLSCQILQIKKRR